MKSRVQAPRCLCCVIDDDVELVRLLSQLFAREGIALRSATTGAAGLDGL